MTNCILAEVAILNLVEFLFSQEKNKSIKGKINNMFFFKVNLFHSFIQIKKKRLKVIDFSGKNKSNA